jgi:hypothetical protein
MRTPSRQSRAGRSSPTAPSSVHLGHGRDRSPRQRTATTRGAIAFHDHPHGSTHPHRVEHLDEATDPLLVGPADARWVGRPLGLAATSVDRQRPGLITDSPLLVTADHPASKVQALVPAAGLTGSQA